MRTNLRWWGWGTVDRGFPPELTERLVDYLQEGLGFEAEPQPPVSLDEIELPEVCIKAAAGEAILEVVDIKSGLLARVTHSCGKSYPDLVRLRRGEIVSPPDLVAYPTSAEEVAAVLKVARQHDISVTPFGGGTSVVGGVEPQPLTGGAISLDMRRMDDCLELDPESLTVRFQAGVRGPELEGFLQSYGFTLGHFPQSFEYSTLGGWVATRSAGQNSTGYGSIDDMVESLQVILPDGEYSSRSVPASATGPSLQELFIGSEGTLGVITEVSLRIRPVPTGRLYRTVMFPDWDSGIQCVRSLVQDGIRPSVVRLSDGAETELNWRMRPPSHPLLPRTYKRLAGWFFESRRLALGRCCALILIFEGAHAQTAWSQTYGLTRQFGGVQLGASPARQWRRMRFMLPFLRDDLMDRGIMVETLETAAPWSRLDGLYEATGNAVQNVLGEPCTLMCHLSHAYPDGASLYFTFMAPRGPAELERWQAVKAASLDAILQAGGTISHHHGIGRDHAPWLSQEIGPAGVGVLEAIKQSLDPRRILNPGKLLPFTARPGLQEIRRPPQQISSNT